jgi:hypothetical protein
VGLIDRGVGSRLSLCAPGLSDRVAIPPDLKLNGQLRRAWMQTRLTCSGRKLSRSRNRR